MVKAVFLDIDGTLMDTNYLHIEAWAQAFEEVGARPPHSSIHHEVALGNQSDTFSEWVRVASSQNGRTHKGVMRWCNSSP